MHLDQLRTLAAIVEHGTFEAAASVLHVTPSAVSQRIKALEAEAGRVLLRRAVPCTPTAAGQVLVRTAHEMELLEREARAAIGSDDTASVLRVEVNADSLATWFAPLLDVAADWNDVRLHLDVEDQDHTLAALRSGDVAAAVTSDPTVVAGCRIVPLGAMRYLPVATPWLVARHSGGPGSGGRGSGTAGVDWARLPVLRFNAKDALQDDALRTAGLPVGPPGGVIPSSAAFAYAVRAGLGWGLLPEAQLDGAVERGDLVVLPVLPPVDVALFWQVWKIGSERLDRLTDAVVAAATGGLRR